MVSTNGTREKRRGPARRERKTAGLPGRGKRIRREALDRHGPPSGFHHHHHAQRNAPEREHLESITVFQPGSWTVFNLGTTMKPHSSCFNHIPPFLNGSLMPQDPGTPL